MNDNVALSCQNYAQFKWQVNSGPRAQPQSTILEGGVLAPDLHLEYSCSKWHNEVREESTPFLVPKQDLSIVSEELSI